jgi:hypothetical protein
MTMIFTQVIKSSFAVRLCNAFDILPGVKRLPRNLSIPC